MKKGWKGIEDYKFWMVVGSQDLYGEEVIRQAQEHARRIAEELNRSDRIPCEVVCRPVVRSSEEIETVMKEANQDPSCGGVIVWMHTFSPAKMWIAGLTALKKPYCHFHTQFHRTIPNEEIDMDFMNLNQSAHGDREHGFIAARMRIPRKVVVGHWEDRSVQEKLGSWMRSAVGASVSRGVRVARFGDNMRQVAVTEGDKVEAQIRLGWQVNSLAVGALAKEIDQVDHKAVAGLMREYEERFLMPNGDRETIEYQARIELAIEKMLEREGCQAYTNTFEDLYGMRQLPGLASQRLMEKGYGYGGEGDWKTAALLHIVKQMSQGLTGGSTFMEDYTYDYTKGRELVLGSHMLEVCPSVAAEKPRVEVHSLAIGGKEPPARLVFEGGAGPAIMISLIDLGGRMRLIVQDVEAVRPIYEMPKLPVARLMWKPVPDLETAAEAWILAGGAHHTVFTYALNAGHMRDFARIIGIEFVHIATGTEIESFQEKLFLSDLAWKWR